MRPASHRLPAVRPGALRRKSGIHESASPQFGDGARSDSRPLRSLCGHPAVLGGDGQLLQSSAMAPGANRATERLAAAVREPLPRLLLARPPVDPGGHLRAGRSSSVARGSTAGYGVVGVVLLILAGVVIWTLTEYWLHRLVFHWEPDHPLGSRMHFIIHGVHHDHPNDKLRLVMPPAVSIPLAALFFGLFWLVFGIPAAFPALRRLHRRLPRLRLHALLPPPLRAEVGARQAAARAAHAPPLPGPPLRLRRLLAALGRRLPHSVAGSTALAEPGYIAVRKFLQCVSDRFGRNGGAVVQTFPIRRRFRDGRRRSVLDEARTLIEERLEELDEERKRLERALADLNGGRRGPGRPRGSARPAAAARQPHRHGRRNVAAAAAAPAPTGPQADRGHPASAPPRSRSR